MKRQVLQCCRRERGVFFLPPPSRGTIPWAVIQPAENIFTPPPPATLQHPHLPCPQVLQIQSLTIIPYRCSPNCNTLQHPLPTCRLMQKVTGRSLSCDRLRATEGLDRP